MARWNLLRQHLFVRFVFFKEDVVIGGQTQCETERGTKCDDNIDTRPVGPLRPEWCGMGAAVDGNAGVVLHSRHKDLTLVFIRKH